MKPGIVQFFRGFVTAFRTLTLLPVPGKDSDSLSSALPWFPVAGGVIGALILAVWLLLDHLFHVSSPSFLAWVAMAGSILLTRALHLDGLSDMADSFGSICDRQRMLDIMKDSRVGAFGVLALIMVLLGKWVAFQHLAAYHAALWIVLAAVVSRTMQVELAVSLPYARAEGGTARGFIADAKFYHRLLAYTFSVILMYSLYSFMGLLVLVIGWVFCKLYGHFCMKRYGGVTGDLLGAGSEIIEMLILFLGAYIAGNPDVVNTIRLW